MSTARGPKVSPHAVSAAQPIASIWRSPDDRVVTQVVLPSRTL
jgi:hypothetical protein